jgi:uncharacterized membrane protein YidH (DUF202 family)
MSRERPDQHFDAGLQHERTALAWERTAVAMMVAGTILARFAVTDGYLPLTVIGTVQLALGGGLLLWSVFHYDQLHGPLRADDPVVHPTATRLVGVGTVCFCAMSLALAVRMVASR